MLDRNDFWQLGKYALAVIGGTIFYLELEKIRVLLLELLLK